MNGPSQREKLLSAAEEPQEAQVTQQEQTWPTRMWTNLPAVSTGTQDRWSTVTTSKLPAVPHGAEKRLPTATSGNAAVWILFTFLEESQADNFALLSARFYGGLEGNLGSWATVSVL